MDYDALVRDFLDDADCHLNVLDSALISLEQNGHDPEVVRQTLGALHTLKGNSGMMGYESFKNYIHLTEELLKKISDGDADRQLPELINILGDGANIIRNALQGIGKDNSSNPDLSENLRSLRRYIDGAEYSAVKPAVDPDAYLGVRTDTIKVDFTRLDALLDLVGELVIFKTRLGQLEGRIQAELFSKPLAKELNESLELMGKTVSGLQEGIMRARMLPVSHVFNRFPKMVRDIAASHGKEIRLVFEGEDTELDKTVIDELGEPLIHIIRNAIDHGIEAPGERRAKGKDGTGTLTLSAVQESNYVIIRVKDDGRGINLERVREIGISRGLISDEDPLDSQGASSLIFAAGFTTKREVDDISGRGIGLDVVHKKISQLNGRVTADSSPDRGTTFTIKLPLSLAIIPALMAEAGGEVYAIPMSAVDENIRADENDIHMINNREVISFREKVMPVIRLDEFFGLGRAQRKGCYMVIIGKADKKLAVAVDRLRGQQEIVIKPLDDTFGKPRGIAGASILGNGRIVLILDVMSFWSNEAADFTTPGLKRKQPGAVSPRPETGT